MGRTLPLCVCVVLALSACDAVAAQEHVTLRATHPDGVPLHPSEGSRRMSGRLPDGLVVSVVRWGAGRRWLEVRTPDGTQGWVVARYLARRAPPDPLAAVGAVWRSEASCLRSPRPPRPNENPRLASWNLRWFPDGSSHGQSQHPTRVRWVACAIAALNVDLVAVQEVMLHARGRAAIAELTGHLSERTGGRWESRFDACPRDGRQHVGVLFDASRVQLSNERALAEVNPLGGCTGHLRPGFAAAAQFVGGRRLTVVTVHLDSGREARDHGHRVESVERLAQLAGGFGDAVILGDFNTMGTDAIEASQELARLDERFARADMRRLSASVPCTEFYRRRGGLLDLAVASEGVRATAQVEGLCAELSCRLPRGGEPEAIASLSDHCPLVVDVAPN